MLSKTTALLALFFAGTTFAAAQQKKMRVVSIAGTNSHAAYPFSKFGALFTKELNPGVDIGYTLRTISKKHHDWFATAHAGYFYHRFVQHGIPLYARAGYRYKLNHAWHFTGTLGAGYFHSVPDADIFKLNDEGTYKKSNGIGRGQAMFQFAAGVHYVMERNNSVFFEYRQQLQAPFIRSYVPLLPYNSIAIGYSFTPKF